MMTQAELNKWRERNPKWAAELDAQRAELEREEQRWQDGLARGREALKRLREKKNEK